MNTDRDQIKLIPKVLYKMKAQIAQDNTERTTTYTFIYAQELLAKQLKCIVNKCRKCNKKLVIEMVKQSKRTCHRNHQRKKKTSLL